MGEIWKNLFHTHSLFSDAGLDDFEIVYELEKLGSVTLLSKSKNIMVFVVNGVKVDFVHLKLKN